MQKLLALVGCQRARHAATAIIWYNNAEMNKERQSELAKALQEIMRTLTAQYEPDKVILFGSMPSGDIGDWSDLDLVIIKDTPYPFFQRIKQVALLCRAQIGVDFLVYTPSEFAQMIAEKNPFIVNEVVQKGKVIYERQPAPAVA